MTRATEILKRLAADSYEIGRVVASPTQAVAIEPWTLIGENDRFRPLSRRAAALAADAPRRSRRSRLADGHHVRLHRARGYVGPLAFMAGQAPAIWAERDRKLEAAREQRRQHRKEQRAA